MDENPLTIREAQNIVDQWIQSFGVRYFSELTNLAILMEEVGEFSRLMAIQYGEKTPKPEDSKTSLQAEMGDIFFVLICLANQMGLSLSDCLHLTLEKNTKRDKDRHKQNTKLVSSPILGEAVGE
jgi:NTP pyrophosphatase (non-canonical NTP hydrolase)